MSDYLYSEKFLLKFRDLPLVLYLVINMFIRREISLLINIVIYQRKDRENGKRGGRREKRKEKVKRGRRLKGKGE